jgi:hypothetical protein
MKAMVDRYNRTTVELDLILCFGFYAAAPTNSTYKSTWPKMCNIISSTPRFSCVNKDFLPLTIGSR